MFSGIVVGTGIIQSIEKCGDSKSYGFRVLVAHNVLEKKHLLVGASIAVSGICLTVEEVCEDLSFYITISQASMSCVVPFIVGMVVNLEPSMTLADYMAGHMVSGHVDAVGCVHKQTRVGESSQLVISVPTVALMSAIVKKGSIAVNGVSLTINAADMDQLLFEVNIIPHTLKITQLLLLQEGDLVNIEVDMIARYVAHNCALMLQGKQLFSEQR